MKPSTRGWPVRGSARAVGVAGASVCLACAIASGLAAGSRPRYGGTVRVEVPGAIRSLDSASAPADPAETTAREAVLPLVFETLVRVDALAGLQPLLAESWHGDAQQRRWQFRLRPGVKLHDGTPLGPAEVAAALRASERAWTVREIADGIEIECAQPTPDLPWVVADPRTSIVVTRGPFLPVGTGPFRIDGFEPSRRLVLVANDGYRSGRPFVDRVTIEMGRPYRDEIVDLELGRTDLVSLLPQDVRRVFERRLRVATSRTRDLVALVFDSRRPAASNDHLRAAVALAIDRASICSVLLQRQGEPARALLPDWLSGYASIFPARYDRSASRSLVASLPPALRTVSLQYPASDAIAGAVADRVAVDAREVGLTVKASAPAAVPGPPPDARLLRVTVDLTTAQRALALLAARLALDPARVPDAASPLENAARFEQALIEGSLVVPLVHVPHIYGIGPRLERSDGPIVTPAGTLNLADAWVRGGTP